MNNTNVTEKAMAFAARIINLHKFLVEKNNERVISPHIIKCGTVIGAHLSAAFAAQAQNVKNDQLTRALTETATTEYWLKLLQHTGNIGIDTTRSLLADCNEIKRLIVEDINAENI